MLIGDIYGQPPRRRQASQARISSYSVFNFDLLLSPWSARSFRAAVDTFEHDFPPASGPVRFWTIMTTPVASPATKNVDWAVHGQR